MPEPPRFSVVVPTYRRPAALIRCVAALAALDYPRDRFEVVVVDDGSPEPVTPLLRRLDGRVDLRVLRQANAGPAAARNAGARAARGRWLAFTDDDCRPARGWLRALAVHAAEAPDALIGGATRNALAADLYAAASQALVSYLYAYDAGRSGPRFFASNNLAAPAGRFAELGGFDTCFPLAAGEDRELCDHWLHDGGVLRYAPEAEVLHFHRSGPARFWRQHRDYGRGAHRFHALRAARDGTPLRLEPLPFYSGLLRYPFGTEPAPRAAALSALLVCSQAANAAGFAQEWWRGRRAP